MCILTVLVDNCVLLLLNGKPWHHHNHQSPAHQQLKAHILIWYIYRCLSTLTPAKEKKAPPLCFQPDQKQPPAWGRARCPHTASMWLQPRRSTAPWPTPPCTLPVDACGKNWWIVWMQTFLAIHKLTKLLPATSTKKNISKPRNSAVARLRWTKLWKSFSSFFLCLEHNTLHEPNQCVNNWYSSPQSQKVDDCS